MKIGINAWLWIMPVVTDNLISIINKVADIGFDWIEIPYEDPSNLDLDKVAQVIQTRGLDSSICVAMSPDRDLIHPDESARENGAQYIRQCIDAANMLGSTKVVGPMYSAVGRLWMQTPEERETDLVILTDQLRKLSEYAGENDVELCIEPLNHFETSFMNLASQAVDLIKRVNHPACKIQLDTFHMNIEEASIGDAIRLAGSHLGQLHVCANDRGAPGAGHLDWGEIINALNHSHFDGALVMESFHKDNENMAKAAGIWQSRASSADQLAQSGLAFLRESTD